MKVSREVAYDVAEHLKGDTVLKLYSFTAAFHGLKLVSTIFIFICFTKGKNIKYKK